MNRKMLLWAASATLSLALAQLPTLAQDDNTPEPMQATMALTAEATPAPALELTPTQQAEAEQMKQRFISGFNRILVDELGQPALARNAMLEQVAQRISDDVGCTEEGTSFNIPQEAMEAGYQRYQGDNLPRTTRNPLAQPIVNYQAIEVIVAEYGERIYYNSINQPGRFYREIGVGIRPCVAALGGTPQYALFIVLGSQPDVIPVLLGYGVPEVRVDEVPATLPLSIHQENTRQQPGSFSRAASLRLSDAPLSADDMPLPYSPVMEWTVNSCGPLTLYYELSDTTGLVQEGQTSIEVVCGA